MTRKLAKSTLDRLAAKLEEERERLEDIIASFDEELESSRLATTGSEFSDPDNADGGTRRTEATKGPATDHRETSARGFDQVRACSGNRHGRRIGARHH